MVSSWQFWALLSAVFAALTALFAKVGVEAIPSDLATFIRTLIVAAVRARHHAAGGSSLGSIIEGAR